MARSQDERSLGELFAELSRETGVLVRKEVEPATTEMTGPNSAAVVPDSKAPSSFEEPMNTLFTADTRPRFSSGVSNCTSVCRTSTLT